MNDRDDELRQAVALFRYGPIADLAHLPSGTRGIGAKRREQADKTYAIPGTRRTRVAVETMRGWLKDYRRGGFEALYPKRRADLGRPRRVPGEIAEALVAIKTEHPGYSARAVIERAFKDGQVPEEFLDRQTHRWKPRTRETNTRIVRKFILPVFGNSTVDAITALTVLHGPADVRPAQCRTSRERLQLRSTAVRRALWIQQLRQDELVETLMASMFSHPRIVETQNFTPAKLRALQQAYKRFPVVFDDVTRDRFNRYADEIVKDETIPYAEYPCFALSMNADARSFKPEIVKRCLIIYTRTALPGNNVAARRTLQRSVANIRDRLTTALYREYLKRMVRLLNEARDKAGGHPQSDGYTLEADALYLSSTILCGLFSENLPKATSMPQWCAPMTLASYQERAFERPRLLLGSLLGPDRYDASRRPPEGCWNLSGNRILVGVSAMEFTRTRADIPDWLLDDTASSSGQIALDRKLTEDFLRRRIRAPRRWFWQRR